ncbi:MAG: aminopeptidase P N-terminal domain-containing protein [Cyclobacteriaceae bacterium]|nr:aminopeptidase P N-terminal domain-containing protein [Cyclobacteriaceae bacterium]
MKPFLVIIFLMINTMVSFAQHKHHYQTDFSKDELINRRAKIMNTIGNEAIALIQGASGLPGFSVFRQSDTFYYLTGLESAHAYLLMNGRTQQAILYLPHRDAARESNGWRCWAALIL